MFNTVNLVVYHYGANNPQKYIDPDGRFNLEVFLGKGPAARVEFGINEGVISFEFAVGIGFGAKAHIDFSTTEIDPDLLGTTMTHSLEAELGVDAGPMGSLLVESTMEERYERLTSAPELTSEAKGTYTDPRTRIQGELRMEDGELVPGYDVDEGLGVGGGGHIFYGVGMETHVDMEQK